MIELNNHETYFMRSAAIYGSNSKSYIKFCL